MSSQQQIPAKVYSEYLENMIRSLKNDEFFQADVRYPLVQEAIKHWLGIKRLPNAEAEQKFNEDYRVLQTFGKIKNLQEACARESAPFPLELVLLDAPSETKKQPKQENRPALSSSEVATANSTSTATTPSTSPRNASGIEPPLEGVLKKKKSEPRIISKETSVRFAEPAEEVEMTIPVERRQLTVIETVLRHPLFSMEPVNVARWWSLQFFAIAVYFASRAQVLGSG